MISIRVKARGAELDDRRRTRCLLTLGRGGRVAVGPGDPALNIASPLFSAGGFIFAERLDAEGICAVGSRVVIDERRTPRVGREGLDGVGTFPFVGAVAGGGA